MASWSRCDRRSHGGGGGTNKIVPGGGETATIAQRGASNRGEETMSNPARWVLAAVVAAMMLASPVAAADERIALVLGNAGYARGPIRTSLADAGLVAEALNSIGFDIVEGADLDQA